MNHMDTILNNFDVIINYYSNINPKKSEIYAGFKKEYAEKIEALKGLPEVEVELERITSLEEIVIEEMELITGDNNG